MKRPCGVVVSRLSWRLTNSTPFSVSSETIESKSRVFLAILEMAKDKSIKLTGELEELEIEIDFNEKEGDDNGT